MTTGLILSGGSGVRMGMNVPKQYIVFRGRPVISYSLETFDRHPMIDSIVIVADKQWRPEIDQWMQNDGIGKFAGYADPGETRQYSILHALEKIKTDGGADSIIIHDAARPLVTEGLITSCLSALTGHGGVLPILPAKDTFYLLDEQGRASKLLPRARLAAGQAPEAFDFEKYYAANMSLSREEFLKINGSSEIALRCGIEVVTVPGDEKNIKITTADDLTLLNAYMEETE